MTEILDAAEVLLDDGSMWCIGCDLAARDLGYDNREAVFVPSNEEWNR